jgi:hypothetical protein
MTLACVYRSDGVPIAYSTVWWSWLIAYSLLFPLMSLFICASLFQGPSFWSMILSEATKGVSYNAMYGECQAV